MISLTIYRKSDGKITKRIAAPIDLALMHVTESEEFFLNCPSDATHIKENTPIVIAKKEVYVDTLRSTRNNLLSACDWTQVPDSPLSQEKRQEWAVYRQALRDFPDTCTNLENPIWPTSPQ